MVVQRCGRKQQGGNEQIGRYTEDHGLGSSFLEHLEKERLFCFYFSGQKSLKRGLRVWTSYYSYTKTQKLSPAKLHS